MYIWRVTEKVEILCVPTCQKSWQKSKDSILQYSWSSNITDNHYKQDHDANWQRKSFYMIQKSWQKSKDSILQYSWSSNITDNHYKQDHDANWQRTSFYMIQF